MDESTKDTGPVVGTAGSGEAVPVNREGIERAKKKRNHEWHDPILDQPSDYSKNPNRLSNVRWPVGEEPYPDVEGTDADSPWVNYKLDVTEHKAADPDQRGLLHGGAELVLKCFHCGSAMHVAAAKTAKEVLEEGGFKFKDGADVANADAMLIAAVCENGHVTQIREDMLDRLIKRANANS